MSSNSNFSIENFNIARFAAQIESNMQAANTEYTRLMPLTDAARTWNLHVYDFRAMVNGVAICAPETTLQPGDPRSTSGPAPRPPLDHTLLQDCPDPGVGDSRRLTGDGSLNLGEDSSLNCGVLQNYIWNEPREGKTAVLRIIFSKELRVGVNVFLANSSGTAQYVRCRDYLCAAIQSSCRVGEEGDGLPGQSYHSQALVMVECGPIEAETRTITFTVLERAAPGNLPGDVPDGACFSDYLYWETDPINGIPRWVRGSVTAAQVGANSPAPGPTAVHIGCEAGGVSTPVGQGPAVVTGRQSIQATAVGSYAGHRDQGLSSVAYGFSAGRTDQSSNCTAVGAFAGANVQGQYSVALGHAAGVQNNDASNVRPTRNGTGQSGCAAVQVIGAPAGLGYSAGHATIAGAPGSGLIVDLTVNGAGAITSASVYRCGQGYVVGGPYDIVQVPAPALVAQLNIVSVGADGISEVSQITRSIVINGSVADGLNSDGLNIEGHPLFPRAPNAVAGAGEVWPDACYVKPIREQTYSSQLARPAGDYRWGLYYNVNTGEIVCSEVGTPGIPNGVCMSEYLYWNEVSGNWEIGGAVDNTGMSNFSVHFGCQAMGDLGGPGGNDGYGDLGTNAVAVGVNSAQFNAIPLVGGVGGRQQATATGPWSGYTGQGRDAVAIGAAAALGVVPNDVADMTSGRETALAVDAGADLAGIQSQFRNSVVLSGRGYAAKNLPLNTLNPTDVALASTQFSGNAGPLPINQFTVTSPPSPSGATISVGDLVQEINGASVPAGTYVCSADGAVNAVITICNADGTPFDLVAIPATTITIASPGSGPQPVLDPSPEVAVPGTIDAGGFFVAPLRSSVRNHILSYDTVTKEILYESFPQHNRLNAGDCYSDYLYWSPLAQKWLVGSLQVHLGCGAGGDDATGADPGSQGSFSVAVGRGAGHSLQGLPQAGGQEGLSVAIGALAGALSQGIGSVSVGAGETDVANIPATGAAFASLGQQNQGNYAVSIGCASAKTGQGDFGVAIGFSAGYTSQAAGSIAIGRLAAASAQAAHAISIGESAGELTQNQSGTSIGWLSGYSNQGKNATAVGSKAGTYSSTEPPAAFAGGGGVGNNIIAGVDANEQQRGSIILNSRLGSLNDYDADFNLVLLCQGDPQPSQAPPGTVFIRTSGHDITNDDIGRIVLSIYRLPSGPEYVQANDKVTAVAVNTSITVEHADGSWEPSYPVNAAGYRVVLRGWNPVANPNGVQDGDELPLQALSQIGETGVDAVADPSTRSPVSGFFVAPIRQITKNYQLSYDPNTKEVTYQYQKVAPDIGEGDCYSEYLYWDDGAAVAPGFPTSPGWYVGGGPLGHATHDLGRIHFGCGAGQYQTNAPLVGTRSNPLTIAVGYEAGQFALGWGVNPTITHADLGYTDAEGTIAIGYRACHESAFPRGVSIGYEAGRTGQGTAGLYTLNTTSISSADSCIAIGNQAGSSGQNLGAVAVGPRAGYTASNALSPGQGAHSVAIGNQAGFSSQGLHAIAVGHQAGCSMVNRGPADAQGNGCFPATTVEAQPNNSIILNAGDPRNGGGEYSLGPPAYRDWGPLQAIAGTSNNCSAVLETAGQDYVVGFASTTGGGGSGLVIYIDAVAAVGGGIVSFSVSNCGNGSYVVGDILTVVQGVGANGTIRITDTENFPFPRAGSANECEELVVDNQRRNQAGALVPMPAPGTGVTGFFVNPVRNVGGGFVMAYNPITKEIKYNASKPISDIVHIDNGDCYSEYLYWDDGAGTQYTGDPGWKVGGTALARTDRGRVHIGCHAGEREGDSPGGAVDNRAADLTIAIGLEAGRWGLGRFDNGHFAGNQNRGNIAIGYQAGWNRMYPRSIAIGYQAGRERQGALGTPDEQQVDSNIAIGNFAGENTQYIGSIAVGANAGSDAQRQFALAVGLQAGMTQQGFHSIALGHKAGYNMPARGPFPAGAFNAQSANSIIVNAGDPKNTSVLTTDWGPLQAISGSSSACGATIANAGTGGYVTGVATTTGGAGHGFIINILSVNAGQIATFAIVSCGSGYAAGDTVTVTGGTGDAELLLNDREIFPAPAASASAAEILCILNQGSQADMPTSAGQPVTGFFVNPVRNVGGGFVVAYDPCTKEIKYNASKAIEDLPDLDDGDCYSEYLYWDDGLGNAYAGDPGWKVGGGPVDGTTNPDRGRVHIGCGAGEYESNGVRGDRAGEQIVAIGYQAGHVAMATRAIAIGAQAGYSDQQTNAIAVGYQAGASSQQQYSIAVGASAGNTTQQREAIAIGRSAGQSFQGDNCIAIGSRSQAGANSAPGQFSQETLSVAIGHNCGHTRQGIATLGDPGSALAIGNSCSSTDQGANSIAIGYEAGQSHGARGVFPAGQVYQSVNSIVVNSGDPKNANVDATADHGPLQAISGSSSACGATISFAGTGGYVTGVATTTGGAGHGFIINILSVNAGQIATFAIVSCGSGYVAGNTVTVTGGTGDATLLLNDREIFPAPAASASAAEILCILNQGSQADMPASAGQPVTGFFVNPVRNVGGGFIVAYDPCTKEIKYNASKAIEDLPDLDDGDCYSEYLYWDDGLGNAYAGDPGWKVGGGPADGTTNPDRGRVHIGCGAGEYESNGVRGDRAGEQIVAIGYQAGHVAMATQAIAIGAQSGFSNQQTHAIAVGYQAGYTTQGEDAVAIGRLAGNDQQQDNAVAIGLEAGLDNQSLNAVAIGRRAGRDAQSSNAVAVGFQAGNHDQSAQAVAVGFEAGFTDQNANSVAVGSEAGRMTQGTNCVAIGSQAGYSSQLEAAVAVGLQAGASSQQEYSIAVGATAGNTTQQREAIAIGRSAGESFQGINCVAIGSRSQAGANSAPGQFSQQTLSVAIGHNCGHTRQGIASAGDPGSALAIGNSCSTTDQGANSIAIGYEAGQSHGARGVFPAGQVYQSVNSIVINSGDPKNAGVDATADHGPLQAVAGESNACAVGSISVSGSNYSVGSATTTGGGGSGMVVEITSVGAGGAVTGVTITDCGSGYSDGQTLTLIQAGSDNNAQIVLSDAETFPTPNPGAGSAAIACVNNQGSNNDMPSAGAAVTGFFVNPVRNCSGGFVMSYNPCTKEIKYNASKLTDHLPDFDLGDCYSEYLYWDDGLGTAHAGDPGWKVGGGPADGTTNPDRGRVHIGCGAGQYETLGNPGTRAGQQSVAIGFQAGHIAMSQEAVAVGSSAGNSNQGLRAVAVGRQSGFFSQGQEAVAIGAESGLTEQGALATAVGFQAGQTFQGALATAVGYQAGQQGQLQGAVAVGSDAGNRDQGLRAVAVGEDAGKTAQGDYAVAVGKDAGHTSQGLNGIAIGYDAASNSQGSNAIAIGNSAGSTVQGTAAVAIGRLAGQTSQSPNGIAIGNQAGSFEQTDQAISIGYQAGMTSQATHAIAIGREAGPELQGQRAIAIGQSAGQSHAARSGLHGANFPAGAVHQSANSIILNSGDPRNGTVALGDWGPLQAVAGETNLGATETFPVPEVAQTSAEERACIYNQNDTGAEPMPVTGAAVTGFFVNPVRNVAGGFVLAYNPCTKEIKYNASKPIDDIPADLDQGDCYSEYLYWDNGADGVIPAGWRKGGGITGIPNTHDYGRVHIGCEAGYLNAAGNQGTPVSFTDTGRQTQYSIAIGYQAGRQGQGESDADFGFAVAIGYQAAMTNQGNRAIAIGEGSGGYEQGQRAVAIGREAGRTEQGDFGIAIGQGAGKTSQGAQSIAIGRDAALGNQGANAVAIGHAAGNLAQSQDAVAIGYFAGRTSQGISAVAIGDQAGESNQGDYAIAIGLQSGFRVQQQNAVAVGRSSGYTNQGANSVAVGHLAGSEDQSTESVAIGPSAARYNQGSQSIAIGHDAARTGQGTDCVAVGHNAAYFSQQNFAVAMGYNAGYTNQGTGAVAIGSETGGGQGPGYFNQGNYAVAIGPQAGMTSQGTNSVAIASGAGQQSQGSDAVAIGIQAGRFNQLNQSVAVGRLAGNTGQGINCVAVGNSAMETHTAIYSESVAIGSEAGRFEQRESSTAVGTRAGTSSQRQLCTAIGFEAGEFNQGIPGVLEGGSVAVGAYAGQTNQESFSIAIGGFAATQDQTTYSIAIGPFCGLNTAIGEGSIAMGLFTQSSGGFNGDYATAIGVNILNPPDGSLILGSTAGGGSYNGTGNPTNATYIRQIRAVAQTKTLQWNSTTKEVTYATKSFVKSHPVDEKRYLVHACLEGPENGLYYRGRARVDDKSVKIRLPAYASRIGCDWTIQVTAKGSFNRFYTSDVDDAGVFEVFAEHRGEFDWLVHGRQSDKPLVTEPSRDDVILCGDGPYTYLRPKIVTSHVRDEGEFIEGVGTVSKMFGSV